uniref:Integrase n=1 Tax=OCS116 cluster bacterium TaxID=2030921 RepID=A0A2A4YUQ3_9PROT
MPILPKQHVQISAIKPPANGQLDYVGADSDAGLSLRVSFTGRKTWFMRYYVMRKGSRKRAKYTIGRFPGIDLKQARVMKRDILSKIDKGQDPSNDRKIEERKASVKTVKELCSIFFAIRENEKYRGRLRKNVKDELSMARCYVIPEIGDYAPQTVTSDDIIRVLNKAQKTCSAIRSNRILALMRVLFKYALSEQFIDFNPTESVNPPAKEYPREIDPPHRHELKELWQRIENGSVNDRGQKVLISKQIQIALKLLLLTGQRSSEISQAPISEFDLVDKVWIISGSRTKNGKPHKIPLSALSFELVKQAIALAKNDCPDTSYLFPGWPGGNSFKRGAKPIGNTACHHALKRVTLETDLSRFTIHDFRKICATQMAELSVPLEIVSEILNHTINTVTVRHYARPNYLPQMREALTLWENYLLEIVGG